MAGPRKRATMIDIKSACVPISITGYLISAKLADDDTKHTMTAENYHLSLNNYRSP